MVAQHSHRSWTRPQFDIVLPGRITRVKHVRGSAWERAHLFLISSSATGIGFPGRSRNSHQSSHLARSCWANDAVLSLVLGCNCTLTCPGGLDGNPDLCQKFRLGYEI